MKVFLKNIFSNKLTLFCFLAFLAIFAWMNSIVPFFGDDIDYSFSYNDLAYTSVFQALADSFREWWIGNGRILVMFVTRLYSAFTGDVGLTIINTLCFLAMVLLMGKYIFTDEEQRHTYGWALLFVCLFCLSTGFDMLYYWASGAAGYVFGGLVAMIWLLMFDRLYHSRAHISNIGYVLWLLLSFVFAFQHEGFVFALVTSSVIYLLVNRNRDWHVWLFVLVFALGACLNIFSPGLVKRLLSDNGGRTSIGANVFWVKALLIKAFYVLPTVKIGYVLVFVVILTKLFAHFSIKGFIKENLLLVLCAIFGLVPALAAGVGGRTVFFSDFFSSMLLVKLVCRYCKSSRFVNIVTTGVGVIGLLYFSVVAYYNGQQWNVIKKVEKEYYASKKNEVIYNYNRMPSVLTEYVVDPLKYFASYLGCKHYTLMKSRKTGIKKIAELNPIPQDFYNIILKENKLHKGDFTSITEIDGGWFVVSTENPMMEIHSHRFCQHFTENERLSKINAMPISVQSIDSNNYFVDRKGWFLNIDTIAINK